MKANLGCGLDHREGYVNIDRSPRVEPDEVVDLFQYPWPWEDNRFDEFIVNHLIEHIPHEPRSSRPSPYRSPRWERLKDLDGFFAFFAELWRVATPGAQVHIVCPYAQTMQAFQDPSHTRYITTTTFEYLTHKVQESATFDYDVPFEFKVTSVRMDVAEGMDDERFPERLRFYWNITQFIYVDLEVVK